MITFKSSHHPDKVVVELKERGFSDNSIEIIINLLNDTYYNYAHFEYAGHLAIARETELEELYQLQLKLCCGIFLKEIDTPDGKVWIQFDYGH